MTASKSGVSRRQFIATSIAGGAALALGRRQGLRAGRRHAEGRLHQSAHRAARRLRRDRRLCARSRPQGAGRRPRDRRQEIQRRDPRPGHAVRSVARRPARQGPDQQPGHRPDAGGLDARGDQPGGRRLRSGRRALPLDRHAVGGLVFRPRRQARRSPRRSNGPIISASASASSSRPTSRNGT